jgi:protein KRI1
MRRWWRRFTETSTRERRCVLSSPFSPLRTRLTWSDEQDNDFKPTWDDDIDITDLVGSDASDDDGALDDEIAQHLPVASTSALPSLSDDEEAPSSSKKSKKEKKEKKGKKSKRDEEGFPTDLLEAAKAGGDADRQALLDKMVDEYYNLDHEDVIGGGQVKTRFHYAKVQPQSFSLSAEEILLATDSELNAFMSLKKLAPYRQDSPQWLKKEHEKQRKKVKELREVLKKRKWGEEVDEEAAERELEKRKERKRRYKEGGAPADGEEGGKQKKQKRARTEDSGWAGSGAVGVGEGAGEGQGEPKKAKKRAGKSERKRLAAAAAAGGAPAAE